jgi:hypothetical protein
MSAARLCLNDLIRAQRAVGMTTAHRAANLARLTSKAATPPASKIPSVATPATAPASLAVEVQLMREIDSALKSGRPDRALALLEQRRDGDGGYMQEERAAVRIFAFCQLGRVESARPLAARFLRHRPRSPVAARVKATCAAPAAARGKSR